MTYFRCFRCSTTCFAVRAVTFLAASNSNWPSVGRWSCGRDSCCWTSRPKVSSRRLSGISGGRSATGGLGEIAIVLVEQYLDFAQELGDEFAVMDRGSVIYAASRADLDEQSAQAGDGDLTDAADRRFEAPPTAGSDMPTVSATDEAKTFSANRSHGRIVLSVGLSAGRSRRKKVYEDGALRARFPNRETWRR